MLSSELVNYLNTCRANRMTFEQIESSLTTSGYRREDIEEARAWYNQTTYSPAAYGQKSKSFVLPLLVFLVVVGIIFGLVFLTTSLIASEKIKLPDSKLQNKIAFVFYSLPGINKPPKIIIEQSVEAHKKVLKNSFDLSVSASGLPSSMGSIFGSNNVDLSLKGFVNYTVPDNPNFNLSFLLGKDLSIEARKKDNNLYLQVPKIPSAIYVMLGLEPEKMKALLSNWISIDTTPLKTEASNKIKEMNQKETTQSKTQKTTEEILTKLLNEKILPILTTTSEKLDAKEVYKIKFKPTDVQVDSIAQALEEANKKASSYPSSTPVSSAYKQPKASEYIKDLEILLYIGKKDSYVYRLDLSFRYIPTPDKSYSSSTSIIPGMSDSSGPISIASVLKFSDYGNDVAIDTPSKSLTQDEFYQEFLKIQPGGIFGGMMNPGNQISGANNAKRRSDLAQIYSALMIYQADNNGGLPIGINTKAQFISKKDLDICSFLVPNYITSLTSDPSLKRDPIKDCKSDYDTGYTIMKEESGKVVLKAPFAEGGESIVFKQ